MGLAAKLYIGIGGAVAITMLASVVAWISFVELGQHQRRITREHIPSITESLRLAQQSTQIAAIVPKLLSVESDDERRSLMAGLGAEQRALELLVEQLSHSIGADRVGTSADAAGLSNIRAAIKQLAQAIERLDVAVGQQLYLRSQMQERVQEAIDAHRRLVERFAPLLDDATFYLVTGYRSLDDAAPDSWEQRSGEDVILRYNSMSALDGEANLLVGLLTEAAGIPEVALMQPLRERFEASVDRFASALDSLSALPEAGDLRREYGILVALGNDPGGIVDLRTRLLGWNATAEQLVEQSRAVAATLGSEVDRLVQQAQTGTETAVAASNRAIDIGQKLLLFLNGIAVIGAIVMGWFYVGRIFTDPVLRVTAAAEAFERQQFDPASLARTRERSDELGRLAQVFTRMAEEVQARTDTLDRLVSERTQELNRKNLALERTLRQIAEELAMAQRMQLSFLPRHYPDVPHLPIYARMRAAREVGGDFYDVIEIDADRVGIVIADVSGKGVPAALLMAVSSTTIKAVAGRGNSPGRVLEEVNRALSEGNDAAMFVTIFYGIVDHRNGTLIYANGGHNAPYLMRDGATPEAIPGTDGIALGLMPEATYEEKSLPLGSGDTIFFYTDGVTEAFDLAGNPFTELRLREVLYRAHSLSVEALGRRVIGDLDAFTDGAPQSDDITCVVIRYDRHTVPEPAPESGPAGENSGMTGISIRLAADLDELARLAEALEAAGETFGLAPKIVFNLNLVLDELVTNTVSYGYGDATSAGANAGANAGTHAKTGHGIEIALRRDGADLVVTYEDDAAPFNPLDIPPPDLESDLEDRHIGGLGIHLVRTMMDSVTYERRNDRNRLVMTKRLDN
jgi:serine phosphatase RsbU (regulator of sigma subunit)/anti-sigma regulatory factor (Ser/Thr protein kinase)